MNLPYPSSLFEHPVCAKGLFVFIFAVFLLSSQGSFAQGEKQVITFSGIIVDGDSSYGVPGVHIYVPRAGRGTSSDYLGMFTMPTLTGDTVIISAVGYKKQRLVVPHRNDGGFSILIDLKSDTTFLPMIEVFPFPSVEVFKEAFMALELPKTQQEILMEKNLNKEKLWEMARAAPMDGNLNHRMYMNQQVNAIHNKNSYVSIPFLNPFAWAEFIKSIKRGDFKKKR
jgi:CarboxypepD_reg-like domain